MDFKNRFALATWTSYVGLALFVLSVIIKPDLNIPFLHIISIAFSILSIALFSVSIATLYENSFWAKEKFPGDNGKVRTWELFFLILSNLLIVIGFLVVFLSNPGIDARATMQLIDLGFLLVSQILILARLI